MRFFRKQFDPFQRILEEMGHLIGKNKLILLVILLYTFTALIMFNQSSKKNKTRTLEALGENTNVENSEALKAEEIQKAVKIAKERSFSLTPHETLGLIENIELIVEDKITGKCWTNVKAMKEQTRLILEQNGIGVYFEPLWLYDLSTARLSVSALGERTEGGLCVGSVDIFVQSQLYQSFGEFKESAVRYNHLSSWRKVVFSNAYNLNEAIKETIETTVKKLAEDIKGLRKNKSVQNYSQQNPTPKKVFTLRRINEMLSSEENLSRLSH